MTGKIALLACTAPTSADWQLGPLPPAAGVVTLIGWHMSSHSVDSGVPVQIAKILATALTSIARISFPVSEPRAESDDDIQRIDKKTAMLTTSSANSAIRLFDDDGFPWHLQGQIGILTASNARPFSIAHPQLHALVSDDWASQIARLGAVGVLGAIRPGVDGDVAGVLSLSDEFSHALLVALERAARAAMIDWVSVSEQELRDALPS